MQGPAIRLTLWTQMNFCRTILVLMTAWIAVSIFRLKLKRLIYPNIGYLLDKIINTKIRKPRLSEEKRLNFVENLNHKKMQCLLTDITQARQISDSVRKEEVNTFCSQFSEIFNDSANSCNNNNNTSTTTKTYKRPWVGRQCEMSRKEYHRAKKMHAKYPSTAYKAYLVTTSKKCKKKHNK